MDQRHPLGGIRGLRERQKPSRSRAQREMGRAGTKCRIEVSKKYFGMGKHIGRASEATAAPRARFTQMDERPGK